MATRGSQSASLTETHLIYLRNIIREFQNIQKAYRKLRADHPLNLVNVESFVPILTKTYIGLQKGTIVPKSNSETRETLQNEVRELLGKFQFAIETSMIPTLHMDSKNLNFRNFIVDKNTFEKIRKIFNSLQFNDVVAKFLRQWVQSRNRTLPNCLVEQINSFLKFDFSAFDESDMKIRIQPQQATPFIKVQIPKIGLDPILEKINPAEILQGSFHALQISLRIKNTHLTTEHPQTKIEKDFLNKLEQTCQKEFGNFITNLEKYGDMLSGATQQDQNKLIQIMEKLHAIDIKEIPPVIKFKNNVQLDTNNPDFYTITLKQAKSLGIITEKGSEKIKKIVHQKQELCQLLQNATREPEPFSWVEDFPELKL